ncbi:hypothetical protein BWD42_07165 [Sphingobacterium sp. CZ-UAM]|uniref:right-handed parallel beta-helix repeat-containing protein n=1 Tax=Sphingobacterium sp. CZ-UAM TaxID=1933868 RepID=UPI000987CBCB|nr:right-handed parallel beta-helix repeat-containing protein [Sphingobacterium sp. CZ-UAM]OOG19681.1 hypothetical protein BWD42_07165 [Sphingobacterium sp. CZ-UAM]
MKFYPRLLFILGLLFFKIVNGQDHIFYVSPNGNDAYEGSFEKPLQSFNKVVDVISALGKDKNIKVLFRGGTYYLAHTINLSSTVSRTGTATLSFEAYQNEKVVISGATKLTDLDWKPWKNGIYKTNVSETSFMDQLFVDNALQIKARFPNYDEERPIRGGRGYQVARDGPDKRYDGWLGFDADQFSTKNWSQPTTGLLHVFQSHNWGNMQYRIKAIDRAQNRILLGEGGWQLQRKYGIAKGSPFFVENILEELDAAKEWFFDAAGKVLYYYPESPDTLSGASIEVAGLETLIKVGNAGESAVRGIVLRGLRFVQTKSVFMEPYEPLGMGDWSIHRSGAITFENTVRCVVEDCDFEDIGGNGVFFTKYNLKDTVRNSRFSQIGESAVCFVGDSNAVKDYITWNDIELSGRSSEESKRKIDHSAGPKTVDYPQFCVVENCLASDIGLYGKQVAGVLIAMSKAIKVAHCTIYDVPRAAICINDGAWGGHVIEHCDIWNTVRETGEHGPFNSWGRNRFWPYDGKGLTKKQVFLDAEDAVVLRNNRIANSRKSISAGNWAIDLDDGSTNYEIYNNLCLGSTLKLRDGYFRKVYNNIFVSAVPMGWHVWPQNSDDEYKHNIMAIAGTVPGEQQATDFFLKPISMPKNIKWGNEVDSNLYYNANFINPYFSPDVKINTWIESGYDAHSVFTDPLFRDPVNGDYSVKRGSPAEHIGFENFPMDDFGHTMSRIVPFEGSFSKMLKVTLLPDRRGGQMYYTLDGSQPTLSSLRSTDGKLTIRESTVVRMQTFKNGSPIGFECRAAFNKTATVTHPSWFDAIVRNKPVMHVKGKKNEQKMLWQGALLTEINDGDMVDATGGFTEGVFVKDVPKDARAASFGLKSSDIIIAIAQFKTTKLADFENKQKALKGKIKLTVLRGYQKVELYVDL